MLKKFTNFLLFYIEIANSNSYIYAVTMVNCSKMNQKYFISEHATAGKLDQTTTFLASASHKMINK